MPELDVGQTTTTDMENEVSDYSVDTQDTDGTSGQKETTYINTNWTKQLGYWKSKPELNRPITALAFWTAGLGYTTDTRTQVILDNIMGWGEDTFTAVMQNMIKTKKFGQDAFAEIMRNDVGTLINLKPLNTGTIKIYAGGDGLITHYTQVSRVKGKPERRIEVVDMLHLCNDRIGDEIHGTSILEVCQWAIDAKSEAEADWRKILHRNLAGVRVIEVDEDDTAKLKKLGETWSKAIDKGEVLILPKGAASFPPTNIQNPENWIRYLEGKVYQAVGVPRVIATSEDFTEAGSKIGFLTFEPVYTHEQEQLEGDLWNQLGIRVKFNRPPSLGGELKEDNAKDGQAFQPNDVQAGVGE